jgi:hypothetical protein
MARVKMFETEHRGFELAGPLGMWIGQCVGSEEGDAADSVTEAAASAVATIAAPSASEPSAGDSGAALFEPSGERTSVGLLERPESEAERNWFEKPELVAPREPLGEQRGSDSASWNSDSSAWHRALAEFQPVWPQTAVEHSSESGPESDTESDTESHDTESYDTDSYDSGSYDTGSYDSQAYDTGSYDAGQHETESAAADRHSALFGTEFPADRPGTDQHAVAQTPIVVRTSAMGGPPTAPLGGPGWLADEERASWTPSSDVLSKTMWLSWPPRPEWMTRTGWRTRPAWLNRPTWLSRPAWLGGLAQPSRPNGDRPTPSTRPAGSAKRGWRAGVARLRADRRWEPSVRHTPLIAGLIVLVAVASMLMIQIEGRDVAEASLESKARPQAALVMPGVTAADLGTTAHLAPVPRPLPALAPAPAAPRPSAHTPSFASVPAPASVGSSVARAKPSARSASGPAHPATKPSASPLRHAPSASARHEKGEHHSRHSHHSSRANRDDDYSDDYDSPDDDGLLGGLTDALLGGL